jgi:2-polyprenyl-3-methyl-5-hydroxy-6-metoxy-1,4-benzoquinol methylase
MWFEITDRLGLHRWRFAWMYLCRRTPWDTGITPPEVMAFLEESPPGRALDLGCGTGTNPISMARRGWRVTGVDFVPQAIRKARAKAAAAGLAIDFRAADVTALDFLPGPFDYALDIGCLSGLGPGQREQYTAHLARLLRPGAWYMLYAWLPRRWKGRTVGIAVDEVEALLTAAFKKEKVVMGEERGFGSAWYWYCRK